MAYGFYRTLTIDKTKVPNTDRTNFPILFSGTYSYLATVANGGKVQNASGFDIIFTSDTAGLTKLDHEIELYTAASGLVVMWVRVPTVSTSSNTVIYLWYGNVDISVSQENINGVWNVNYKGVWHLHNSASPATDSTDNANSGVQTGGVTFGATGKINSATSHDGTDDTLNVTDTLIAQTTWSISAWVKPNATSFVGTEDTTGTSCWTNRASNRWIFYSRTQTDPATGFGFSVGNNVITACEQQSNLMPYNLVHEVSISDWALVTFVNDNNTISLYLNGNFVKTAQSTGKNRQFEYFEIVTVVASGQPYSGPLDDLRILDVALSADWITTEYNNQNSPSTFYSLGDESSPSFMFQPIMPFLPMLVR